MTISNTTTTQGETLTDEPNSHVFAEQDEEQGNHRNNKPDDNNIEESPTDPDSNTNNDEDDEDDITVIVLDQTTSPFYNAQNQQQQQTRAQEALAWIDQAGSPELEARRRQVLMRELKRTQRASFYHFLVLCAIPTCLLIVVIATVVGQEEECASQTTHCELEPRNFLNAFTTRCICDAISYEDVSSGSSGGQQVSQQP